MRGMVIALGAALAAFGLAAPALAAEAKLDSGSTAWLLTATALVLFMTLPGLALFYGGLVRARNLLSVLLHCSTIACLVSVLWLAGGYALAFGDGGAWQWAIGSLGHAFLAGIGPATLKGEVPELLFFVFQATFAIITPALIVGAYAERISFGAMALFSALWLAIVYVPVCHWVWGEGWLAQHGTMDFAGGIVVHVTAGISALVLARLIGPREGFATAAVLPHSPGLTMAGAGMLWVGWFGFNAGSALSAGGNAALAMTTTHLSAAAGGLCWMLLERGLLGRVSLVGSMIGIVAGLATVTPGAGFIAPAAALVFGIAGAAIGFFATQLVKQHWRIDDSLDVFAVHGLGGAAGTLLTGVFASPVLGGQGFAQPSNGVLQQLGAQALGVAAGAAWSGVATYVLFRLVAAIMIPRVDKEEEAEGLDVTQHGERAYDLA